MSKKAGSSSAPRTPMTQAAAGRIQSATAQKMVVKFQKVALLPAPRVPQQPMLTARNSQHLNPGGAVPPRIWSLT